MSTFSLFLQKAYNIFIKTMQQSLKRQRNSSNIITSVKPQVYNFELKNRTTAIHKNYQSQQYIGMMDQMKKSNIKQISWRPKLPTKKLFQEPKFLLSIQRKKIRVINGLRQSELSLNDVNKYNKFKGEKIKIKKQIVRPKRVQEQEKSQPQTYIHHDLMIPSKNTQRGSKTPIVNFNLHHLIQKRKTFRSQNESQKKGSNTPYYTFVSSTRFNRDNKDKRRTQAVLFTRSKTHMRGRSQQNPGSTSKTVQLKIQLQNQQTIQ